MRHLGNPESCPRHLFHLTPIPALVHTPVFPKFTFNHLLITRSHKLSIQLSHPCIFIYSLSKNILILYVLISFPEQSRTRHCCTSPHPHLQPQQEGVGWLCECVTYSFWSVLRFVDERCFMSSKHSHYYLSIIQDNQGNLATAFLSGRRKGWLQGLGWEFMFSWCEVKVTGIAQ